MNLSDRIKAARKHAGLTQLQLAERVGLAQTAISQLESGKTQRSSYLTEIAFACSVDGDWLASGRGQMLGGEDGAQLDLSGPDLPAPGSSLAGHITSSLSPIAVIGGDDENKPILVPLIHDIGARDDPTAPPRSNVAFRLGRGAIELLGIDPEKVVCVSVHGGAMSPVLNHGSVVAVDTSSTDIIDGKIYVIRHSGLLRTLFAYRLPGGGIRLRSMKAQEYPDEAYSERDVQDQPVIVIGRVFWGASFL